MLFASSIYHVTLSQSLGNYCRNAFYGTHQNLGQLARSGCFARNAAGDEFVDDFVQADYPTRSNAP